MQLLGDGGNAKIVDQLADGGWPMEVVIGVFLFEIRKRKQNQKTDLLWVGTLKAEEAF